MNEIIEFIEKCLDRTKMNATIEKIDDFLVFKIDGEEFHLRWKRCNSIRRIPEIQRVLVNSSEDVDRFIDTIW